MRGVRRSAPDPQKSLQPGVRGEGVEVPAFPEKRKDHRLGAHGHDIADGHVDAGFEEAVAARLAGHRTITFPNIEFFFLILLMAISI